MSFCFTKQLNDYFTKILLLYTHFHGSKWVAHQAVSRQRLVKPSLAPPSPVAIPKPVLVSSTKMGDSCEILSFITLVGISRSAECGLKQQRLGKHKRWGRQQNSSDQNQFRKLFGVLKWRIIIPQEMKNWKIYWFATSDHSKNWKEPSKCLKVSFHWFWCAATAHQCGGEWWNNCQNSVPFKSRKSSCIHRLTPYLQRYSQRLKSRRRQLWWSLV